MACKKSDVRLIFFANLPEKKRRRSGQGITPALMKLCHWIDPLLVAQVKFTEWTSEDQLRQKRARTPPAPFNLRLLQAKKGIYWPPSIPSGCSEHHVLAHKFFYFL
jgi:hypothetical protein